MRRTESRTPRVLAETLTSMGRAVVSGGTDNRLVDATYPLGVTGRQAEHLLDEVGITVNKNAIPFDLLPPNTASGIRVGTPAMMTRGTGPNEMRSVGSLIVRALTDERSPRCSPASSLRWTRSARASRSPRLDRRLMAHSHRCPGSYRGRGPGRSPTSWAVSSQNACSPGLRHDPPHREALRSGRPARRGAPRPRPAHPAGRRPGGRDGLPDRRACSVTVSALDGVADGERGGRPLRWRGTHGLRLPGGRRPAAGALPTRLPARAGGRGGRRGRDHQRHQQPLRGGLILFTTPFAVLFTVLWISWA